MRQRRVKSDSPGAGRMHIPPPSERPDEIVALLTRAGRGPATCSRACWGTIKLIGIISNLKIDRRAEGCLKARPPCAMGITAAPKQVKFGSNHDRIFASAKASRAQTVGGLKGGGLKHLQKTQMEVGSVARLFRSVLARKLRVLIPSKSVSAVYLLPLVQ